MFDVKDVAGVSLDPTTLYLREIGFASLLTAKEEVDLARKIAKGDNSARNKMIESNLRLVVKISRKYINKGLDLADLIEEGNIGLMHAVGKFDPEMGFRFSTYATWWIRQTIERAIMNQARTIRLPVYIIKELSSYWQAMRALAKEFGRDPTPEEVADKMKKPVAEVRRMLDLGRDTTSLDAFAYGDGEQTIVETIADEIHDNPLAQLESEDIDKMISSCIEELDLKQQAVISRRFGLRGQKKMTLDEIGKQLGLTRERVRQIQMLSLRKLQRILRERGLGKEIIEE